ncbi:MAG: hypothetical protein Q7V57_18605 [Actinomycetota bacterium]|nr:hypothetical protein [Actinomycetota bacterium]
MVVHEATIYEGQLELTAGEFRRPVAGRVWASLVPRPTVRISIDTGSLTDAPDLLGADAIVRFGGQHEAHRALFAQTNDSVSNGKSTSTARGIILGTQPSTGLVDELTFELINFPARAVPYSDGPIVVEGWWLELMPTLTPQDFAKVVEGEALFVTTYSALLCREDGKPFSAAHGLRVLDVVRVALSFAAGARVGLWNLRAALAGGRTSWLALESPNVAPWYSRHQWLSIFDRVGLITILEALLRRHSHNEETWDVDQLLIAYHAEANGVPPMEMRIAAAQSGLELISWDHLVESGDPTLGQSRSQRKNVYTALSASAVMEMMIHEASLPLAIPPSAAQLTPLGVRDGDATGTSTGPVALARVRNAVTHPRRRHGDLSYPHGVWFAAWRLSVHYLELLILRRLGYTGAYVDRFSAVWHGDIQQVPWSTQQGNGQMGEGQ